MAISSPTVVNENYTVTIMQYPKGGTATGAITIQAPMPESFMYDAASQYAAPFSAGLTGNQMIDTILRVGIAARLITQSLTAQFWQGSTETELGLELELQAESDPDKEVRQKILQLLKLTTPSTKTGGLLTSPGPKIGAALIKQVLADSEAKAKSLFNGTAATDSSISNVGTGASSSTSTTPSLANNIVAQGQQKTGALTNPEQTISNGTQKQASSQDASTNPTFGSADYFNQYIDDRISIKIGNYAIFNSVVITNVQVTYESQFDINGLPHYARVAVRFKPLFMVVQSDLDKIFLTANAAKVATTPSITIGSIPVQRTTALGSVDDLSIANPIQSPDNSVITVVPGTGPGLNGGSQVDSWGNGYKVVQP